MRHPEQHIRRRAAAATAALVCLSTTSLACTDRPVVTDEPTTKTNVTKQLATLGVGKVDLLFDIDNSASMGDKQAYLVQAIPDLIDRLITPNCVDDFDTNQIVGTSHDDGQCDRGRVEFPPVHDLHIGIVSSSLGPRLGNECSPNDVVDVGPQTGLNKHADDGAHLLGRAGGDEHALADAEPSSFLDWFPKVVENTNVDAGPGSVPQANADAFEQDFADLVQGVHEYGCGIESQLESWYRFLVQPDPYDHLELQNGVPTWVGVDTTILQERHDFLRPDSLVAVVVLSDENDSEIDVRALGGQGYEFMTTAFNPSHGTAICATNPDDPACEPCDALPNHGAGDPGCTPANYSDPTDWGYDINLRHVHMKQKYGIDPQYPMVRYVTGLSNATVPDRRGEYPGNATSYVGSTNCTNPLFAAQLPDGSNTDPAALCDLPQGTARTKELVFYAHIGGVPHELLHYTPNDPQASALSDDDWVKILGKDPAHHDYTGIDPHMVESFAPRAGLAPASAANDADPIHGREWVTNVGTHVDLAVDREYACTFAIAPARDCTKPDEKYACDCSSTTLTHDETSPLCDATNTTMQVKAKAYPTIRELYLARLLGTQGVIESLCPIHTTEAAPGDPLFGYRPAMAKIIDRLKNALTNTCLPERLVKDPSNDGKVACLVLATLPQPGDEAACAASLGLSVPEPDGLTGFRAQMHADWASHGGTTSGTPDPDGFPVCAVQQLGDSQLTNRTCVQSAVPGFCYVTGAPAGLCDQAMLFAPNTPPNGSKIDLQCIE